MKIWVKMMCMILLYGLCIKALLSNIQNLLGIKSTQGRQAYLYPQGICRLVKEWQGCLAQVP